MAWTSHDYCDVIVLEKAPFWGLRDELVGNYYSDGMMERLAGCQGMLRDYSGFWQVGRSSCSSTLEACAGPYCYCKWPNRRLLTAKTKSSVLSKWSGNLNNKSSVGNQINFISCPFY